MKIYTRTGDNGETSLFGGGRVRKSHLRIETYGTVDELNSVLGVIRAVMDDPRIDEWLLAIQDRLFVIGSDLATPMNSTPQGFQRLEPVPVKTLEQYIDQLDDDLKPLKNFILPGGTMAAAQAHVARTVCRRAERLCVQLEEHEDINANIITYLNRLSDFLFTLARWFNHSADVPDVTWSVRD